MLGVQLSYPQAVKVGPPPFWLFDELGYPLKPSPDDVEEVTLRCTYCGGQRAVTFQAGGLSDEVFDWIMGHDTVVSSAVCHSTAASLCQDALRKARSPFSGTLALRVLGDLVGLTPRARGTITWKPRARDGRPVRALPCPSDQTPSADRWSSSPARVPALSSIGAPMSHRAAVRRMRDWYDWWGLRWLPRCLPVDLAAASPLQNAMGRLPEPARSLLLLGGRYFDLLMRLCATDAHRSQALWMGGLDHTPTPLEGYARVVQAGYLPIPGPLGEAGYVDLRGA